MKIEKYWTFSQSTGQITDPNGVKLSPKGYSGYGKYRNDPTSERIPHQGVTPCGFWQILPAYPHDKLGPVTMNLEPCEGTDTFGRSLFRIHGFGPDDPSTPQDESLSASHGCVIAVRTIRLLIAKSKIRYLLVVK